MTEYKCPSELELEEKIYIQELMDTLEGKGQATRYPFGDYN